MRLSGRKTTLAVLRATIGIKDFEMAEIIGRSPFTLHSIESGRLDLGEDLALTVSKKTGVSLRWLLDGDTTKHAVDRASRRYTRSTFEEIRSKSRGGPNWTRAMVPYAADACAAAITSILHKAFSSGDVDLAIYKLSRAIKKISDEFGASENPMLSFASEAIYRSFSPATKRRQSKRSSVRESASAR